jgi:hypothetical protein
VNRYPLADVFADLNANADDVLTLEEIRGAELSLDNRRLSLAELLETLRLGAGGEDVSLTPGLSLRDVESDRSADALSWYSAPMPRGGR